MPALFELLSGHGKLAQLREVRIEDLLRREPAHIDDQAVRAMVRGKRVLVTGAGGSIGSELCRQILRYAPSQLVLLGHGENSIFAIHNELLATIKLGSTPIDSAGASHSNGTGADIAQTLLIPVIADIRFPERIRSVFAETRPQIVFHAAAHKHVPLMEWNPVEAFTNNVLGTRNLLQAAQTAAVERFVMISSDKAVNPTSVMGASKRAAEMHVLQAAERTGLPYVAVRFGNVLGSRGSVVLTFQQQIAAGGPLTVTHAEMTRYFMTIPEAVQLLLHAAELGKGGEIFMLDMGEPVKIMDLAQDLIRLSGLEVGRDIDIAVTGMRPGEKLYEELFLADEEYRPTRHTQLFIAAHASSQPLPDLESIVHLGTIAVERNDQEAVLRTFTHLVPEYRPQAVAGKDQTPVRQNTHARHTAAMLSNPDLNHLNMATDKH